MAKPAKLSTQITSRPQTDDTPPTPLLNGWEDDRELYTSVTGVGGDGGGFSDLDGFTGGLDEDINEPPPWANDPPLPRKKAKKA